MIKKSLLALALCGALSTAIASDGQLYPTRTIKLVVGFGAGGGTDGIARLYAAELQKIMNTPVYVENKPSAYEQIAGRTVQMAEPDGYTLWVGTTGGVIQAPLMRSMPYDPRTDFTHIGVIAEADAVLAARNGFPAKTVGELVSYARANPTVINYGSGGTGAPSHLLIEYIQSLTNIQMTHVPYKSASEVVRELTAGNIDLAVAVPAAAAPLINAGRIHGIAVTAKQRLASLPETQTFEEGSIQELKGMSVYAFYSILGPANLPKEVQRALNEAFNKVSSLPKIQESAISMNFRPVVGTSEELTHRINEEMTTWGEVAKRIQ